MLAVAGDDVVVTVTDDGVGFDPQASTEGFGLVGMQERVALVGGELTVESTQDKGRPSGPGCRPATARA